MISAFDRSASSVEEMEFELYVMDDQKYWFTYKHPLTTGDWIVGYAGTGRVPTISKVSTDRRKDKLKKGYRFVGIYYARELFTKTPWVGHGGDRTARTQMSKVRRFVERSWGEDEGPRRPSPKEPDQPKIDINDLPERETPFFSW